MKCIELDTWGTPFQDQIQGWKDDIQWKTTRSPQYLSRYLMPSTKDTLTALLRIIGYDKNSPSASSYVNLYNAVRVAEYHHHQQGSQENATGSSHRNGGAGGGGGNGSVPGTVVPPTMFSARRPRLNGGPSVSAAPMSHHSSGFGGGGGGGGGGNGQYAGENGGGGGGVASSLSRGVVSASLLQVATENWRRPHPKSSSPVVEESSASVGGGGGGGGGNSQGGQSKPVRRGGIKLSPEKQLAGDIRMVISKMDLSHVAETTTKFMALVHQIRCDAKDQKDLDWRMGVTFHTVFHFAVQSHAQFHRSFAQLFGEMRKTYHQDTDDFFVAEWSRMAEAMDEAKFRDLVWIDGQVDYDRFCEQKEWWSKVRKMAEFWMVLLDENPAALKDGQYLRMLHQHVQSLQQAITSSGSSWHFQNAAGFNELIDLLAVFFMHQQTYHKACISIPSSSSSPPQFLPDDTLRILSDASSQCPQLSSRGRYKMREIVDHLQDDDLYRTMT